MADHSYLTKSSEAFMTDFERSDYSYPKMFGQTAKRLPADYQILKRRVEEERRAVLESDKGEKAILYKFNK